MRRPAVVRVYAGIIVCGVLLAGCSNSSSSTASSTPPAVGTETPTAAPSSSSFSATGSPVSSSTTVDGTWNGSWQANGGGGGGDFTVNFTQTGSSLNGTLSIDVACLNGAKVTGKVNGDSIEFGSVNGQCSVDYKGTINGDQMSGTYGLGAGTAGTWKASKA
jgi:hypothetical protein